MLCIERIQTLHCVEDKRRESQGSEGEDKLKEMKNRYGRKVGKGGQGRRRKDGVTTGAKGGETTGGRREGGEMRGRGREGVVDLFLGRPRQ